MSSGERDEIKKQDKNNTKFLVRAKFLGRQ